MTHDFRERLAYSHSRSDAPYWPIVYRRAFPDLVQIVDLRQDGWHQRAGRDRALVLSTGKTVYVDEKVRERAWGDDVLVEVWSQYPQSGTHPYPPARRAVPGWAVAPKDTDYLAYAFERTQTCHLFPFLGIRSAWEKHGPLWREKAEAKTDAHCWVIAQNDNYDTVNIAVPLTVFQSAIADSLTISWKVAA